MNSLEKLIKDLEDSKDITENQLEQLRAEDFDDNDVWGNLQSMYFVANALQGAINRLIALNEEEGLPE